MDIPQFTHLFSYWWTFGFYYGHSGTCPLADTCTYFCWVYVQSWCSGSRGVHMFCISIDCKELSKVAIPISTPTRSILEFQLLHIGPKIYFKSWVHKEIQEIPKGQKEKQRVSWDHQLSEIWTGSQCWFEDKANVGNLFGRWGDGKLGLGTCTMEPPSQRTFESRKSVFCKGTDLDVGFSLLLLKSEGSSLTIVIKV